MQNVGRHTYRNIVGLIVVGYGRTVACANIDKFFGSLVGECGERQQSLSNGAFVERNIGLGSVEQTLCLFEVYA